MPGPNRSLHNLERTVADLRRRVGRTVDGIAHARLAGPAFDQQTLIAYSGSPTVISLNTTLTNILAATTVSVPSAWTEMDILLVGSVLLYRPSGTGNIKVAVFVDSPSGTTLWRAESTFDTTDSACTVPLSVIRAGITADTTVRVQGQVAAGASGDGEVLHRQLKVYKFRTG